jgi:KipI family sensor histidine kinase inhibitor
MNDATTHRALKVEPLGDRGLLLILGEGIDAHVNDRVHQLAIALRQRALPGVHDLVPAYATLAVHYDPACWIQNETSPHAALATAIQQVWRMAETDPPSIPRHLDIPVCYGGVFGPDLEDVAAHCGLSRGTVIDRHTAVEYRVFMLGFTPGFPYLGELDPILATPRRATPRPKVAAGSVGIAGKQTGIYSLDTPGGWQIIGRTPRRLFDATIPEPCLLRPGDRITFRAIDEAEYLRLSGDPA